MAKLLPYFKWYPADAETDERYLLMSDSQVGFYHRCLNKAWMNDGLPSEPKQLARLMHVSDAYLRSMWTSVGRCFQLQPNGRLGNPRQEEERHHAFEKSGKASVSSSLRQNMKVPGSVYLVSRKSDGAIKIGSSSNVKTRFSQLKHRYHPDALTLLRTFEVNSMGDVEVSLHQKFESKRIKGEWFSLSEDDIRVIESITPTITPTITPKGDTHHHPALRAYESVSVSSEDLKKEDVSVFDLDAGFREVWSAYPRKGRTMQSDSRDEYVAVMFVLPLEEQLQAQVDILSAIHGKWATSEVWAKGFVMRLKDWIKNRRWNEDPEQAEQAPTLFTEQSSTPYVPDWKV